MEQWFIYALLSALFAGLYSFFVKISAEKNHDASLVTGFSNITTFGLSFIAFAINPQGTISLWLIFIVGFVNAAFYFINVFTRIESLKNIHTTIYFPIYKTLGPILMVLVGIIFFSEKLTTYEIIGVVFGILTPLLLITKAENKRQTNLKRGMILLVIGTVAGIISSSMAKVVTVNDINIFLFMTLFSGFSCIISFMAYKYKFPNKKSVSEKSSHYLKRIGILNGVLLFLSVYFFTKSTIEGNLGVVFTINSFSILVPIILSIFIYKEHFNTKKALAIVLTIASLWFFN